MRYFYSMKCQTAYDRFRWSEWWLDEEKTRTCAGMWWVNSDVCCPFPDSGDLKVLDGVLIVLCVLVSDQMTFELRHLQTSGVWQTGPSKCRGRGRKAVDRDRIPVEHQRWQIGSTGHHLQPPVCQGCDTDRVILSRAAHGSKERNSFCNGMVASSNPVMRAPEQGTLPHC